MRPRRGERVEAVLGVGVEQPARPRQQLGAGQEAVAVVLGRAQRVDDARVQPARAVRRRAERAGQRVGGGEADAVELGQRVGVGLQRARSSPRRSAR